MEKHDEITMNELLLKMDYYKEICPIIHLYKSNEMDTFLSESSKQAYKGQCECTKLEYLNEKLYHVISKYYLIDQQEYILEMAYCLDDQVEMSQNEKNELIQKYLGHHDKLYIDVLTGAYNRRFYEEKIKHSFIPGMIAMMDVDDFKIYNDTFGHGFGDEVLKMIVKIIKQNIAKTDYLIRYGGDEFLIYSPENDSKNFEETLQKILDDIHQYVFKGYEKLQFSISAGVAHYKEGSLEKVVSFADHLLYHAKRQKNTFFTENDHRYFSDSSDTRQTILVVDDYYLNREILQEILKDDFYLIEAKNGQECMDYIEQYGSGISLVLLDIIMPDKDGFDVLKWMQEENWIDDIPVILISSEDSVSSISKGFEMGASDYITRPFDHRIVYQRVNNIIKLYAKQKRLMDLLKKQIKQ